MGKDDSEEPKYGHHHSFRSVRDNQKPKGPSGKWMLVACLLIFAVLAVEKFRKRSLAPPSQTPQVQQVNSAAEPSTTAAEDSSRETDSSNTYQAPPSLELVKTEPPASTASPDKNLDNSASASENMEEVRYELRLGKGNSYFGKGEINGISVNFLADTGASAVIVPEHIAVHLGLKRGEVITSHTAGGVVPHYMTVINRMNLGKIEITNISAAINPSMQDDFVLLGMTALKMLDMEIRDGKMILKRKQAFTSSDMRSVDEENFKRSVSDCKGKGNKFDQQTLNCLRGR